MLKPNQKRLSKINKQSQLTNKYRNKNQSLNKNNWNRKNIKNIKNKFTKRKKDKRSIKIKYNLINFFTKHFFKEIRNI